MLVLNWACRREEQTPIPIVPTDFTVNLNLPEYSDLAAPGNFILLTGGSRGIIVYRISLDQFVAFDRHCTYQAEQFCRVVPDDTGIIVRDLECCQSAFNIFDGIPIEGPASFPLYQYRTMYNGVNLLRIYN
jgi:hypothetical protein